MQKAHKLLIAAVVAALILGLATWIIIAKAILGGLPKLPPKNAMRQL